MILKKIKLKNFLSYGNRPQEINLDYKGIICLSGNNGNGKSALLDAITWALWGMARKSQGFTKNDDLVMRLGSTYMFVTLEFESHNVQYMVTRSCEKKSNRLNSDLACFIYDNEEQVYKNISLSSIKAAQDMINMLLGFTYDTFINTVFLRQGQSNEFSRKTPKERKQLLIEILKIDRIELIRQRLAEEIKEYNVSLAVIDKTLLSLPKTLQERELEEKKIYLQNKHSVYKEKKVLLQEKKKELELYEEKQKVFFESLLQFSHQEELLQKDINSIITNSNSHIARYKQYKQIYLFKKNNNPLSSEEITILEHAFMNISHDYKLLLERYNNEKNDIIKEQTTTLLSSENTLKNIIHEYTKIITEYAQLETFLTSNFAALYEQKNEEKNNALIIKETGEKKNTLSDTLEKQYLTKIKHSKKSNEEIEQSLVILLCSKTSLCPVCDSPLTEQQRTVLIENKKKEQEKNNKKILVYEQRIKNILQYQKKIKEQNEHNKKNIITLEKTLKDLHEKVLQEDLAKKRLLILTQLKEEKNNEKTIIENQKKELLLTQKTKIESFELEYKDKITLVKNMLLEKETFWNKAKKTYEHFNALKSLFPNFEQESIAVIRAEIKTNYHKISIIKKSLHTIQDEKSSIKKLLHEHSSEQLKNDIKETEQLLTDEYAIIMEEYAHYKVNQDNFTKNKELLTSLHSEYIALKEKITLRSELLLILDRDHLQASLIEDIIPIIEQEANSILEKLSHGSTQLAFESLRDLKSGKTKETLDIIITDSFGSRPYEFFSGGEAFRIDLAIRIALAKLLMYQSGCNIKTLIIDEGFGSQDSVSLDMVIDCLHSLQSEFDTIFLVSHLPSMKDLFSLQLVVNKTIEGSYVTATYT